MKALYFSHDYSARNDERLLDIRADYGWEGYGLYFGIIEMMAENGGHLNSTKLGAVALGLAIELPKLKAFVASLVTIGLLYDEAGLLRSKRLDKHFAYREQCAEAGRKGGQKSGRWQDKSADESATIKPTISHPDTDPETELSAINKRKESKEKKESKRLSSHVAKKPPSIDDVVDEFKRRKCQDAETEALYFLAHHNKLGWIYGKNKIPIVDWKAAVTTWLKPHKNYGSNTDKREQRIDDIAKFGS